MGADISCHRFFVGDADGDRLRGELVAALRRLLTESGFQESGSEDDAARSFVLGPPGRWLFLGDSAGSTEWADPESFDALSRGLSLLGPVVDVNMSDSAAVHFHLYRDGGLVDRFGNAAFPFNRFPTEEEAAAYRGRPELWGDLLLPPATADDLRAAWVQEWQATEILGTTARLFGWDPDLLWVGYTFDDEGIPTKYDAFLAGKDLTGFSEYHFKPA